MTEQLALADVSSDKLLATLREAGLATRTSLDLPANMTEEQYVGLGNFIADIKNSTSWWIGDWLIWGAGAYQDRADQLVSITELTEATLRNYQTVCSAISRSRRRENVSFSVHAVVASLPPKDQDEFLELAEMHGWTVKQITDAKREAGFGREPKEQPAWSEGDDRTVTIARRIVHEAHPTGDGRYLVSGELIAQLRVAIGEPDD